MDWRTQKSNHWSGFPSRVAGWVKRLEWMVFPKFHLHQYQPAAFPASVHQSCLGVLSTFSLLTSKTFSRKRRKRNFSECESPKEITFVFIPEKKFLNILCECQEVLSYYQQNEALLFSVLFHCCHKCGLFPNIHILAVISLGSFTTTQ